MVAKPSTSVTEIRGGTIQGITVACNLRLVGVTVMGDLDMDGYSLELIGVIHGSVRNCSELLLHQDSLITGDAYFLSMQKSLTSTIGGKKVQIE